MIGSLSKRYARALIEIAREEGSVERIGVDLDRLASTFVKSPEILETLSDTLFHNDQRLSAMKEIAERAGLSGILKNFILLLVQKERIGLFPEIQREYGRFRDEILGIIRTTVFAPTAPEGGLLQRIEKILGDRLKKKVIARGGIRPNMIGGLILEIDHTLYDGSVRSELNGMRNKMLKEPIG